MKTEYEIKMEDGRVVCLTEEQLINMIENAIKKAIYAESENDRSIKPNEEMKNEKELRQIIRDAVRDGFAMAGFPLKKRDTTLKAQPLKEYALPRKTKVEKEYKIEELNFEHKNYNKGDLLTKDGVISLFCEISKHAANNQYYVGVTCNPEEREDAHNAKFLAVVDCPSMEAAGELEKQFDKKGFDAGKLQANLHKSKSKKIYIYKEVPRVTKQ